MRLRSFGISLGFEICDVVNISGTLRAAIARDPFRYVGVVCFVKVFVMVLFARRNEAQRELFEPDGIKRPARSS
jgi:hypothetical protein